MSGRKFLLAVVIATSGAGFLAAPSAAFERGHFSRVYVTAYHCATDQSGAILANAGDVSVEVFGRTLTSSIHKKVQVTLRDLRPIDGGVKFYFEILPGNYEMFVGFPNEFACNSNGPLLVTLGADRHLYTSGVHAVTDWHGRRGIAGKIAVPGVTVRAAILDRPAKCGDDSRYFDLKYEDGVMDDGAYYANLPSDNKVDHMVVLVISGALFTERKVLITEPDGGFWLDDFAIKDVTPEVLQAAAAAPNKFACARVF